MTERSRLMWRCRRGIREMDILFQKFMQQHYAVLSDDEKKNFESFLEEADLDILSWIMGKSAPTNPDYYPLITYFQHLNTISE